MDKNNLRHILFNEISALDTVIKQLASVRPNVSAKQERFEHSLSMLVNIKNEMQLTLNHLNNAHNSDDTFTK